MNERPVLSPGTDAAVFRSYYYLKEELTDFCRQQGLQTTGGKLELTDRIARFLETGEKSVCTGKQPPKAKDVGTLTKDSRIESPFVCSEKHRAFFESAIGSGFSFNVAFQKWLKGNPDRTYGEAVDAYYKIIEDKKKGTTVIDKQFEYNTYIRAFFKDNSGRTLEDAIKCWKYKKSIQGHNRYEASDLAVLDIK